jgi:glutaredoxin|tara:strand:- start:77 stop:361 length:285 start_codon:yes stop_codon:yes gene_type:complete
MYKVFTKPNCQFCVRAKELLDKLNIPYETYHLGENLEGGDGNYTVTIDQMFEMIGKPVRSMPQIMVDDKLIGGFTDLREYLINEGKINFEGEKL